MSDTGEQHIKREMTLEHVEVGDGRTLDMRVVPYNVARNVSDDGVAKYPEMWLPGVFSGQKNAAHRILVNVEHERGIGGVVGKGLEIHDEDDGFHLTARMLTTQDADKALELVNAGSFDGVSLEAVAEKSVREDGIVKRVKARLINVALCRYPAFEEARVLAVREEVVTPAPIEVPRLEPNVDLEERLERIGFETISRRTVVRKPWNPAADRFEDDEWQTACVLDRGESFTTAKTRFGFPVLEPNGDLNVNGLHDAAQKLRTSAASPTAKAAAARRLVRYYRQAGETPSSGLLAAAAR